MTEDTELKLVHERHAAMAELFQSNAGPEREATELKQLLVDRKARDRMPLTREKFVIKEDPELVQWEREVRLFLSQLSQTSAHRISAVMIFEWATGISVTDHLADGRKNKGRPKKSELRVLGHLRAINKLLTAYFGQSYKTQIANRPIGKAYRKPVGWAIREHRPITITLYAEWLTKTLEV